MKFFLKILPIIAIPFLLFQVETSGQQNGITGFQRTYFPDGVVKTLGQYVNGTVYDESGNTLSNVNVTLKGSTHGVTTDVNGFYSIKIVDERSVLVFSYTGFETKEIKVGNQRLIVMIHKT